MDEEVVAMDNFGVMGIAQQLCHLRTLQALDAVQVLRGVVDEAHTDLPAFTDHAHHSTGFEGTFKATDAAGEQGTALFFQGTSRALIHEDDALRVGLVGHPVLAAGNRLFAGADPGAHSFTGKGAVEDVGAASGQDERRNAELGRTAGRHELGLHAARAHAGLGSAESVDIQLFDILVLMLF